LAIDTETLVCEVFGKRSSHVREGVFSGVLRSVSPDRSLFQILGVDPSNGRCRHAEMQMIEHRIGIAGLGMGAAVLLFDLAETGLDIPSLTPAYSGERGRSFRGT
jgi:hypothetical protein